MHLYLAYPLLFHLSRKKGPEWVLIFTLVIQLGTLSILSFFHLPEKWPFWYAGGPLFLKFWFTWTVGFYAAEVISGRAKTGFWLSGYTAFAALILGVVATAFDYENAGETPLALSMGWILIAASRRPSYSDWKVWFRSLAFSGALSYCLYCIHLPLLRLTRALIFQGNPSESIVPVFVGAAVSFIGALVLYLAVDRWAISWSRAVGKKT
jgi:peptidoglycan/LPS O-acetylase OafA/YrhL